MNIEDSIRRDQSALMLSEKQVIKSPGNNVSGL